MQPDWGRREMVSDETRRKMSEAARRRTGEQNSNWRGGPISKICEVCGAPFQARHYQGETAKYCSRSCLGRARAQRIPKGLANPNARGGTNIYRRLAGADEASACVWCGWAKHLIVHHRDGDHHNSSPENLVIICRSCHQKLHGIGSWLNPAAPRGTGHHKARPGQPGTPEFPG